jgi:hypothetical protein
MNVETAFPRLIKVHHTSTKDSEIVKAREIEWNKCHGQATWQSLHRRTKSNQNAEPSDRRDAASKKPRQDGKFVVLKG